VSGKERSRARTWEGDGGHAQGAGERREGGEEGPSLSSIPTPSRGGRASRDRGLSDAQRRHSSQLEEVMRRKGVEEAWSALEEMQGSGLTTDKFTVSRMLIKTVGDQHTRMNAPKVYRAIGLVERFIELQPKDVDEVLFNALLDTCCRLKDLERVEATVQRMRELSVTPSPVTLGILVKTYGQAGDLPKVLQVWSEMEQQRGQANAVTYGCMIDACVKCGNLEKAVEIFDGMRKTRKHRNTILYTTLIKGYGLEKDLTNALKLFREMSAEGVPYNTITFNSIIDACVKCGDVAQGEALLREMMSPESALQPDLITFSTLLKGYCNAVELDKALQVAQTITERGLRCDELVYNTLMDGCSKANDITAGVGLFEEMVQAGMRPSSITHSILMRLHQRAGYEEDAAEAVAQLYQHHGLERPGAGDRGRGPGGCGRKARSPASSPGHSLASDSPLASPVSSFGQHPSALSQCAAGWGEMPLLPDFSSRPPTAPSTPLASPCGTPMAGQYVPIESLQCHPMPRGIPQLPGCGSSCSSETPFGGLSCSSIRSVPSAGVPMVDGAGGGLPAAGLNAFAMPTAPGDVRGGMMQMPLWGFPCGPMHGPGHMPNGESPMTQGFVVMQQGAGQSVMQQGPCPAVGGCASTPWGAELQDNGGMETAGNPRLYSRGGC
jgi:pentatricopeptide repeat protein